MARRAALGVVGLCLVTIASVACNSRAVTRPVGYFRLGPISDLQNNETYFPELRIMLRRDQHGYYAMSTACSFDGSALSRTAGPSGDTWESSYSESVYDARGHVIHGPARVNLPYYDLKIESGVYGGPIDTMYVQVGVERPEDWRFRAGHALGTTLSP